MIDRGARGRAIQLRSDDSLFRTRMLLLLKDSTSPRRTKHKWNPRGSRVNNMNLKPGHLLAEAAKGGTGLQILSSSFRPSMPDGCCTDTSPSHRLHARVPWRTLLASPLWQGVASCSQSLHTHLDCPGLWTSGLTRVEIYTKKNYVLFCPFLNTRLTGRPWQAVAGCGRRPWIFTGSLYAAHREFQGI